MAAPQLNTPGSSIFARMAAENCEEQTRLALSVCDTLLRYSWSRCRTDADKAQWIAQVTAWLSAQLDS